MGLGVVLKEGDPAAETWVHEKALAVLEAKAGIVAASIRRKATRLGLDREKRAKADRAAEYLHNKHPYLDHPTALKHGWPIATGVIEGACRHLVKDRMDITGARWGLAGAEAVLKLRALTSNGDFDAYWRYHLAQEPRIVHRGGIHFQGLRYLDLTLAAFVGESVTIRYDPRDLAEIRVYHQDRFLCRAITPEFADQTISLRELQAARSARRRGLRSDLQACVALAEQILPRAPLQARPATNPRPQDSTRARKLRRYRNE